MVSNGHVTDDVICDPQKCCECEAVRSAILATAWLLVGMALASCGVLQLSAVQIIVTF